MSDSENMMGDEPVIVVDENNDEGQQDGDDGDQQGPAPSVQSSPDCSMSLLSKVKLLLHCADGGTVPYLTPALLQRCFPPQAVHDVLYIGLSVKDTCIVPVYHTSNKNNNKNNNKKKNGHNKEEDNDHDDKQEGLEGRPIVVSNKEPRKGGNAELQTEKREVNNKPRGYEYSSSIRPDSWLLPYQRVTVPTFDLIYDSVQASLRSAKHHQSTNNTNKNKNSNNHQNQEITNLYSNIGQMDEETMALSTNKNLYLWTCNGRHPISCEHYTEVATVGLASQVTVPLFDELFPLFIQQQQEQEQHETLTEEETTLGIEDKIDRKHSMKNRSRRREVVLQHNKAWTNHLYTALQQQQQEEQQHNNNNDLSSRAKLWIPIVITNDTNLDADDSSVDYEYLSWIIQQLLFSSSTTRTPSDLAEGLVVLGWQHIQDSIKQKQLLRAIIQQIRTMDEQPNTGSSSTIDVPLLQNNCNASNNQYQSAIKQEVTTTVATTKTEKTPTTIAILSVTSLQQILDAVVTAITSTTATNICNQSSATIFELVIGTNLPTHWARSKKAFIANFSKPASDDNDACIGSTNNNDDDDTKSCENHSYSNKKRKMGSDGDEYNNIDKGSILDENCCIELYPTTIETDGSISLIDIVQDHPWFSDTRPIVPGCTCLTCLTHTRSYIYHLVCAHELLAEILLFIHNLHHMLELIRTINQHCLVHDAAGASQTTNNDDEDETNNKYTKQERSKNQTKEGNGDDQDKSRVVIVESEIEMKIISLVEYVRSQMGSLI